MPSPIVNLLLRSALDPDAVRYCSLTGASDRQNISRFFRGLKGLGMWDTSFFWMLRASQNYGTGATVAPAGGLAGTNMTLTNGPQWGANGVVCLSASSQYGSATGLPDTRTGSLVSIFTSLGTTSEYISMLCNSATRANGLLSRFQMGGTTVTASTTPSGSIINLWTGAGFHQAVAVRGGTSFGAGYDGGAIGYGTAPTAIVNSVTTFWMNTREDLVLFCNATHALHMVTTKQLTDAENAAFYSLYKSTIGQGLGLP